MTDSVYKCPHCYSPSIYIIGCYVYAREGVPLKDTFSYLDFDKDQVFQSQLLYKCANCNKTMREEELSEAANLLCEDPYWEQAINGDKVPLICPVCKNREHFIQERLALTEESVDVTVEGVTDKKLCTGDLLSDNVRETIVLNYRCTVENCTGVVTVNEDTFKVTPL